MAETTEISWADATFSPWWGCTKISPACDNCYAESFSRRVGYSETGSQFPIWGKDAQRRLFGDARWNEPLKWDRRAAKLGIRPRVFCGSMCDVMEDRPDLHEHRARLYDLIEATPSLDWLLLTKRPQNFRRFLPKHWLESPRRNVFGMTTCESEEYSWRIQELCETPFAVRGLSCEPLLGPLNLRQVRWNNGRTNAMDVLGGGIWHPLHGFIKQQNMGTIHWVIVGGESGHHARPMHPDWARSLRDQCVAAGVAFHYKQWGEWLPRGPESMGYPVVDGRACIRLTDAGHDGQVLGADGGNDCWMQRVGKKAAGRLLDGRTWDEVPMR